MDCYVGSYTNSANPEPQGITRFRFDPATGALTPVGVALTLANPTWVTSSEDGSRLYAVTEVDGGYVVAVARDLDTGDLRELNRVSTHGSSPCHATLTLDERFLLVANYTSGTIAVLPVMDDGTLGEAVATAAHSGSGVVADRQGEAHAHQIMESPDRETVFVCDLGSDEVYLYPFNRETGALGTGDAVQRVHLAAGAGPRHLAFAPNGNTVYIINELDSTVVAARWDGSARKLTPFQTVSTVPDDFSGTNYPSQILVSPDGRFVYGANRLHDSVVAYAVDAATGELSTIGWTSIGSYPRNIQFSPDADWMLVSNQNGDSISVLRRDAATGMLEQVGEPVPVPAPSIVVFVP